MARRNNYDDRYDDEFYDDPEGMEEELDEEEVADPEEGQVLQQVPWFAIAFAVHAIALVILQTIVISSPKPDEDFENPYVFEDLEDPAPPEIPEQDPEEPEEEDEVVAENVEVETYEEAVDTRNEDPTETEDNNERAPSEVPSDSNIDANNEASGFSAALGAGGNAGGGGGPGGGGGNELLRARKGGRSPANRNVQAGLRWLADHQEATGEWDSDGFADRGGDNGRNKGSYGNAVEDMDWQDDNGHAEVDLGLTGLATLAFLGAGHTHQSGEFSENVKAAIRYMTGQQGRDGAFGTLHAREYDSFMYGHALCTMAMAEAYLMTGSLPLKASAESAINFIAEAQNVDEEAGPQGWRYGVRPGISDTSVTGWMALALKSAKMAGLDVPQRCWDGAVNHLKAMTGEEDAGGGFGASRSTGDASYKTGYTEKAYGQGRMRGYERVFEPNGALDSINILTRFFVDDLTTEGRGGDANTVRADPIIRSQARDIISNPPSYDGNNRMGTLGERDYYYWYYASLAIFQMGPEMFRQWEAPMREALVTSQRLEEGQDETYRTFGSWDTDSAWGKAGGRVYATAINVLTLEVYYRYQRR